jgi:hypothetical protein
LRELFVAILIRLYARLLKQGFDIIPAQPELISPAALAIAVGIKIVSKHKISPKITLRACCNRWLR